jgi:DNA-binding transcriptional LysR family regulator
MDRLEAMNVLQVAVETGEFVEGEPQAVRALASVSRKVSDLETHLKTALLVRSARGWN